MGKHSKRNEEDEEEIDFLKKLMEGVYDDDEEGPNE